jgi:hypothetical protein
VASKIAKAVKAKLIRHSVELTKIREQRPIEVNYPGFAQLGARMLSIMSMAPGRPSYEHEQWVENMEASDQGWEMARLLYGGIKSYKTELDGLVGAYPCIGYMYTTMEEYQREFDEGQLVNTVAMFESACGQCANAQAAMEVGVEVGLVAGVELHNRDGRQLMGLGRLQTKRVAEKAGYKTRMMQLPGDLLRSRPLYLAVC